MCTVLLPLNVNAIAVNKYIISYHIIHYFVTGVNYFGNKFGGVRTVLCLV